MQYGDTTKYIKELMELKNLLDLSAECTSEKTTITRPAIQITTPKNFLNLYFVFRKNHVRNRTQGIVQQSNSMTLVIDVYWYALTTAKPERNKDNQIILT